jgi:hypothetical protein
MKVISGLVLDLMTARFEDDNKLPISITAGNG